MSGNEKNSGKRSFFQLETVKFQTNDKWHEKKEKTQLFNTNFFQVFTNLNEIH